MATAQAFSELWAVPTRELDDVPLITREQAAGLAGVRPDTISKWVQRGYITPLAQGCYSRSDLLEFLARRGDSAA